MFPFNTNYPYHNFPFCFNYELQHQSIYPQILPMFQSQIVSTPDQFYLLNSKASTETQDEIRRYETFHDNSIQMAKQKRITKKLIPISLSSAKIILPKKSKVQNTSFKYFDPAQAPPITSLRNKIELQADFNNYLQNLKLKQPNVNHSQHDIKKRVKKLQILLKEPDPKDFPFLICKKRKYYRNMKRRYSVLYFEQRTYYIENNIPIPPQLQPKNKHKKINHSEDSDCENANQSENSLNQNLKYQVDGIIPEKSELLKLQPINYPMQNGEVKLQVQEWPPYLYQ